MGWYSATAAPFLIQASLKNVLRGGLTYGGKILPLLAFYFLEFERD